MSTKTKTDLIASAGGLRSEPGGRAQRPAGAGEGAILGSIPMDQTSDLFFAFARAFGVMAETLTLPQRHTASAKL